MVQPIQDMLFAFIRLEETMLSRIIKQFITLHSNILKYFIKKVMNNV